MGEPLVGHQTERVSWTSVQGDLWHDPGGLASPKIFNVAVDSMVCHWLLMTVEDKAVIQGGLGNTVSLVLGVFYAEYGLL